MSENKPIYSQHATISREQLLIYLTSALQTRSIRFGRQAALSWLATYPGDLQVSYYLAKFLMMDGKTQQAIEILGDICRKDPEFEDAQEAYAIAHAGSDSNTFEKSISCAYALGKNVQNKDLVPAWGIQLRSAIKNFRTGQNKQALPIIEEILSFNLDVPLAAIIHLYLVSKLQDQEAVNNLAALYLQRWPESLAINYFMIDSYFKRGDDAYAVKVLHRCATHDPHGLIAARVWGKQNPYAALWPEVRSIVFNVPLPAEIAALFGWNKLASGAEVNNVKATEPGVTASKVKSPEYFNSKTFEKPEETNPKETNLDAEKLPSENEVKEIVSSAEKVNTAVEEPVNEEFASEIESPVIEGTKEKVVGKSETTKSVEEAFERLAQRMNQKNLEKADGRYPMYIILSTKKGLLDTYGPQTAAVLEKEMNLFAEAAKQLKGWGALVYFPDDQENNPKLGLPVAKTIDPWELKLALADLDKTLAEKGSMIGAVLIVGGNDVVPFHRLPNPTEDADTEVYSDNPYATVDSNYFVPEWPVGRLPGEKGNDAGLLLATLRQATAVYTNPKKSKSLIESLKPGFEVLLQIITLFLFKPGSNGKKNFGYSAAVWKKASAFVFNPIGESQNVLLSPPEFSGSFPAERINYSELGYFNLHGLSDSAEWYGQPDASGSVSGVQYPVALKPVDVNKTGMSPEFVFTEACYGAHILEKSENEALSLKFLSIGSKAVAGSTCISYGSIDTPLIGADLLGYLFWKYLNSGLRVGDAFVKAKMDFVREMNKRQDYLDGEDQKTLISFVLYGDPMAIYSNSLKNGKGSARQKTKEDVRTSVETPQEEGENLGINPEKVRKVKEMVEGYLPGIDPSRIVISKQMISGTDNVKQTSDKNGIDGTSKGSTGKMVVTISKQVKSFNTVHQHYARATLDSSGKMIKLAVSR